MTNRSGVGFVQFEDEHVNNSPPPNGLDPTAFVGEFDPRHLFDPPLLTIPAAITELYFESDDTAGMKFAASALMGDMGALFDPTIGPFGGYRIAVALDGSADGVRGDIDANVTLLLLADPLGIPDPNAENIFQIGLDPDNVMIVYDPVALGIPEPSTVILAAIGLVGLAAFGWRRRKRS